MKNPSVGEIFEARKRIRGVARWTPLDRSLWLSQVAGCDVYLKLECWQHTRSFKIRGAYNAIASLQPEDRARGLVTASAGNHGQAVALAAREVGAKATIFVPSNAPDTKKARIRMWGAQLREVAGIYDDAQAAARAFSDESGAIFVHAFSDAAVVAGQGTVGLEIIEDLPIVREVVVPVGGGGLIAGIGTVMKAAGEHVVVHGVQSDRTPAMYEAFRAGQVVSAPIGQTLADGLAGGVEEVSFQRARAVVDGMRLVPEERLPDAIRDLYANEGIIAEGAAAVPVAALVEGLIELRGPAVLVISGGNIDAARFAGILTRP